MAESDEDLVGRMHQLVYATYLQCPIQKICVQRVIAMVLRGTLSWTHESKDGKTHTKKIPVSSKEYKIWTNFATQLIKQLKIFGYTLYRVTKIRDSKRRVTQYSGETTSVQDENVRLEVANGQGVQLRWNEKNVEWEVYSVDGAMASDVPLTRKGWHILILNEPSRLGAKSLPVLSSAAANAQQDSALYASLKRRIDERDRINTQPCVYTTVSKNLVTTGGATHPWFTSQNSAQDSSHIDIPGHSKDFNSLMSDRLSTLRKLDELSAKARESTRKAYQVMKRPQLGKQEKEKPRIPIDAHEMFISDGRDAHEMSHRQGQAELHQILDRITKEIYFVHDVTPQASGMGGSSERLTSNDRLAQIAITVTEHHVTLVRSVVQDAITKLSRELSQDDSGRTYVKIWPCISAYNLQQVESFLTPEALTEAYACIIEGLPPSSIDAKALKKRQQILLLGEDPDARGPEGQAKKPAAKKPSAGDVDAGGDTKRPEPRMTEAQKSARRDAKAQS
jgi:hypothetical protein